MIAYLFRREGQSKVNHHVLWLSVRWFARNQFRSSSIGHLLAQFQEALGLYSADTAYKF